MRSSTSSKVLSIAAAAALSIVLFTRLFWPFADVHGIEMPGEILVGHLERDLSLNLDRTTDFLLSLVIDIAFCFVLIVILFKLSRRIYRQLRANNLDV